MNNDTIDYQKIKYFIYFIHLKIDSIEFFLKDSHKLIDDMFKWIEDSNIQLKIRYFSLVFIKELIIQYKQGKLK